MAFLGAHFLLHDVILSFSSLKMHPLSHDNWECFKGPSKFPFDCGCYIIKRTLIQEVIKFSIIVISRVIGLIPTFNKIDILVSLNRSFV